MTGVITVAPPGLDADRPDGQSYTITVMAREETSPEEEQLGETSTETKVSITVLDVNDNAPEFSSATYTATAQENTPRGVPLTLDSTIEVSDKDQTDKSQFMLSVEKDGLPYSVFDTSPPAGVIIQGSTTVIIRVFDASALDFEKTKSITFQLVARENNTADTFIGSTTVTVFLEDANDNSPVFDLTLQPSDVTVTEHEALGTVLATFTATDADSGDYGSVSYSLEDDMDGKFAMDPITGDLSVAADLDREAPGGISHHLVVLATDNMAGEEANRRSTRLNVEVKVQDINDNAPQFHPHPPSVTVQESASSNTVLMTLTATDRDEGDNGRVAYRIVRITSSPISPFDTPYLFAIDAATGVVSVGTSLIGHSGTHVITFEASDSASEPRRATTEVTVHVLDVNVHAPVFTNPDEKLFILTQNKIPEVTVMEEQPPGSLVLQVNAVDEDIKENGRVYYYIVPELTKDWQNFRIDRVNGTLTNQYRLDREEREYFQIRLRAEDNGSPNRLSKEIPLRVNVIGIDDNSPVFPVRRLHVAVGESLENARVGSVDIATDADSDAGNRVRCYYLYGGEILTSFSLQKLDGELFLQNPLNRTVTPEIHLIVKVTRNCSLPENHFYLGNNHSFNATDTSLLEVYVEVQDINDNPPVFKEDALTVGMLDNVEIGTSVFELHDYTTDEDTEMNSQNKFRLLKTGLSGDMPEDLLTPPPFVVKSNGSVLTNRRFRANLLGFFVLTVEAFDDDNQTDTGDLRIYLVSDIQRVKLVFAKQPDEVRGIMGELVRKLSAALGYDVIADRIATHITADGRPDVKMTDVFIHARFRPSQEIVPTSKLERAFDYNEVVWSVFQEFGVRYALPALRPEQEEDSDLLRAFIIVSVFLVVLCLLLVVILVSIIRRCRRKLLAATSAAYAQEKPTLDAYVPPGTNKYLAASNPLFEGKKHPDVDRLSAESLDVNVVDTTRSVSDQDSKPADDEEEQEMYLQLFDESPEPAGHFSKLAMVLNDLGDPLVKDVEATNTHG
nr:hypothetical protein BaRGS_026882 [Batillaria attramentaria]